MRKIYYITIISILAIICLQGIYLYRTYNNYAEEFITLLDNSITNSLNDELYARMQIKKAYAENNSINYKIRPVSEMTAHEQDSLRKADPRTSKNTINLNTLRKRHIGETKGEIIMQVFQDIALNKGYALKLPLLDSIFKHEMKLTTKHCFLLLDNKKQVIDSIGDKKIPFAHTSQLYPIGTKGLQFVQLRFSIPLSDFLIKQIGTLIASVLLTFIALTGLFYQLTILRKAQLLLTKREQIVNGTIHDLKSPLGSIVVLLNYMKKKAENEKLKATIEQNLKCVQRMVENIETLLQLAQSDKRALILKKKELNIVSLTEDIKTELDRLYDTKTHSIIIQNKLPERTIVEADPIYIGNVLRNLMENALIYADPGVKVQVCLQIENGQLKVSVQDNGWGIPQKYHKKLFLPFFRVPQRRNKNVKGYGIGLAQTKTIIQAHGGQIKVDSPETGGSIFTFTIPTS